MHPLKPLEIAVFTLLFFAIAGIFLVITHTIINFEPSQLDIEQMNILYNKIYSSWPYLLAISGAVITTLIIYFNTENKDKEKVKYESIPA